MPTPVDTVLRREIAGRLKHARIRLLYTSSAMAREMKVTPQRWHNYESGARPFELPIMVQFCQRFGLTTDYLIRGIKADAAIAPSTLALLQRQDEPEPLYGRPKPAPRKKKRDERTVEKSRKADRARHRSG